MSAKPKTPPDRDDVAEAMGLIAGKLDGMDSRLTSAMTELRSDVGELKLQQARTDAKVDRVDAKVDNLAVQTHARFERLESTMNENHLTLNRKLDLLLAALSRKRDD